MEVPQVQAPHLVWHPRLWQTGLCILALVPATRVMNFITVFLVLGTTLTIEIGLLCLPFISISIQGSTQ